MTTFLRLKLTSHLDNSEVLINVGQIISIHPSTAGGSIIVTTDHDPAASTISVKLSLGELHSLLVTSGSGIVVL